MVVGHEGVNQRRVDKKDNPSGHSFPCLAGEVFQVPAAAGSYGIGEHGDPVAEEGAGFDFQEEFLSVLRQEKIVTVALDGNFPPDERSLFKTRESPCRKQVGHHVVCQVGVEQDGPAFVLDGKHRVFRAFQLCREGF